jgi:hypothetical protein
MHPKLSSTSKRPQLGVRTKRNSTREENQSDNSTMQHYHKLSYINIVRVKIGETVLAGSTNSKVELYNESTHAIGFKIDLGVLLNKKNLI